ncbi:PP2C family protein-serine/threonine phosphatase [Rothia sp. CCM 9419]|uniref:PP2C family protein-serine/threonine phosphatase n=1 Tax=Rothia sp. CCM 9419 TaxID=3402662 RepID=UPI003ADB2A61
MGIAFRFAARSDVGRVRSKNDDSGYAGHYLAVVADGMGGHVGGDVASATTVLDLTPLDHSGYEGSAGVYLADEIQTANIIMNELVDLNPSLSGMGTTCTALLVDGEKIELAHIGDSRAYRLRNDVFEQITTDHTFVQRLLEEGRITPEQALTHPHKNVIMRVLGDVDASPELELLTLEAECGEKWVLSSDGLDAVVGVEEIEEVMRSTEDLKHMVDSLVDLTLDRGAPDNVTVVALSVIDEDALSSTVTSPQPIIPLRQYSDEGEFLGVVKNPHSLDEGTPIEPMSSEQGEDEGAPSSHRAPWRRRLPVETKIRNALTHGKWRGESFSDGVFNMMTETSGVDERPENIEDSSAAVLREELAERPHQLVGAASNATNTGMIPTVTKRTVAQRATLVTTPATLVPVEEVELPQEFQAAITTPERSVHSRWGVRIFTALLVVGTLFASVLTFASWVSNQYYVGINNEKVAVFNGVPQSLGAIHFYKVVEETSLEVAELPEYSQSLVRSTISAHDLSDATRIVSDLRQQVDSAHEKKDQQKPSASATPVPSSSSVSPSPSTAEEATRG